MLSRQSGITSGIFSTVAWTVRLSGEDESALAAQAEAEGRSKSEITRDALREYLMRRRSWSAPLLADDGFDLGGPIGKPEIRAAMREQSGH